MMVQYNELKSHYSDCILFYRLGDFYEMFNEDAKIGAEILDITLTKKALGKDGNIPMAGVPYHAVDSYISKLVKAGYKIALCEQLTEPKAGELVERGVVRIITPGTLLDDVSLQKKENNYICSFYFEKNLLGVAIADISTGVFYSSQYSADNFGNFVLNDLFKYSPAECVLPEVLYNNPQILKVLKVHKNMNIFRYSQWDDSISIVRNHFSDVYLRSAGFTDLSAAQKVSSGLLSYLKYTQNGNIDHIRDLKMLVSDEILDLDRSTIANLELIKNLSDESKRGTLVSFLDKTKTPMGGRLLRNWVIKPSCNKKEITNRLSAVEELAKSKKAKNLEDLLAGICDIERLIARLSVGRGNPKDLVMLKQALWLAKKLTTGVNAYKATKLKTLSVGIGRKLETLALYIDKTISDDPPFDPKSLGVITKGVNADLDKLRTTVEKSKYFISDLEAKERKKSGINSLKVKFNQVFGYYIEITKSNLDSVPENYIRKQTLVNAERYITPELKEHEEIILTAQEIMQKLETAIFLDAVEKVLANTSDIQHLSTKIAEFDCLYSFARLAKEKDLVKPKITLDNEIEIVDGRHPMVEENMEEILFVPNDTLLNSSDHQLLLITGPNMAGKSVYIRQTALIVLMAHIGCFVPCKRAKIGPTDKIFVRSGAYDAISMGMSTFMIEMMETAHILKNATPKSLVVMDEIGRGTSTYDGISLAWAIVEHLVTKTLAKALFATHYHELQKLEELFPDKIKNYQVEVDAFDFNEPVFLHKVIRGGADASFGVSVARLAKVPEEVCVRADELLQKFSTKTVHNVTNLTAKNSDVAQYNPYDKAVELLRGIDIGKTTPLEALNILAELTSLLN